MALQRREVQRRTLLEATRQVDAERRTWRFSIQLILGNVGFALAPLVPHSSWFFGALTWRQALVLIAPGQVAVLVSVLLYRRQGSKGRAYQVSEAIESFLLYGLILGMLVLSQDRWSPLWGLCPFTAAFWAITKPFFPRLYGRILALAHGSAMGALLILGRPLDALVAVAVGLASLAIFEAVARPARERLLAEADRDFARARVNEHQLEAERDRIARSLTAGISERLARLVERLDPPASRSAAASAQARTALAGLSQLASGKSEAALPHTLEGLARLIEQKARPLCVEAEYRQTVEGDAATPVGASTGLAALRIAQELVRNAVTHGEARTVTVELAPKENRLELTVRDDGKGLRPERLASATGGLKNAQRWSGERGGSFERLSPEHPTGTALRVMLPLGLPLDSANLHPRHADDSPQVPRGP